VPVTIIVAAVFTPEREIDAFAADRAGFVQRIFFLREKPLEKPGNCFSQSHA
jgi:hypothetical protein